MNSNRNSNYAKNKGLLVFLARQYRKNPTTAEKILWQALRNRQLDGYKFRRQHPYNAFILDFYCASAKLGIEIDGDIHLKADRIARDAERDKILTKCGIKVIRFNNHEVIESLDATLLKILDILRIRCPRTSPTRNKIQ